MPLTPHDQLILQDLQQLHRSRRRKQGMYWLKLLTGGLGLGAILMLQPQNLSTVVVAALCGGLLGVCIEKAYLNQIVTLTLKLYRTYLDGGQNG